MSNSLKGNVITPGGILYGATVSYDGGIITGIESGSCCDCDNGLTYIAPGFVDIHVHGGGGSDFMDGTPEAYENALALHASHGTATLLPTTLTSSDEELFHAFDVYRRVQDTELGTMLGGLHLEGPYFSPAQAGAQDPRYLRVPEREHYEKILSEGRGIIRRMSVAPELEGALELGTRLSEEGICASMGHSDALIDTVREAIGRGYTHLTHFYSAMSGMVRIDGYRHPGLIECGYIFDSLTVEVIADGRHLPESILGLVFRAKGVEGCALVTDAMRGAGQSEGKTILGSLAHGQECYIDDGVAKMPGGTAFAGSVATADKLVRTAILAGASLADAVRMMSETPARIVGLNDRGIIAVGKRADFTLFDGDINVKSVISGGKTIFEVN